MSRDTLPAISLMSFVHLQTFMAVAALPIPSGALHHRLLQRRPSAWPGSTCCFLPRCAARAGLGRGCVGPHPDAVLLGAQRPLEGAMKEQVQPWVSRGGLRT